MALNIGIVGLPNVGKSTIFNAITAAGAETANYPFCTIDPNKGVVEINDKRLDRLSEIVKPNRVVRSVMEFVDIAGLVKGASKGEGLGNQFLTHIRETDAIAHVVRCFEDENIIHVANRVNPLDDMEVINLELMYADLDSCEKQIQRAERRAKTDKTAAVEVALLKRYLLAFENGKLGRTVSISEDEKALAKSFHFITTKPVMMVCNVKESELNIDNDFVKAIKEAVASENIPVIKICGTVEAEISEMNDANEKAEFLASMGIEESGLDQMVKTGYTLLNLQSYFTAGVQEVRSWTIHIGDSAPQAAGVIHTDFEKGFIKAEVISYNDFVNFKGEAGAKLAGKVRMEGREYIVKDGDVMHFRFNV